MVGSRPLGAEPPAAGAQAEAAFVVVEDDPLDELPVDDAPDVLEPPDVEPDVLEDDVLAAAGVDDVVEDPPARASVR